MKRKNASEIEDAQERLDVQVVGGEDNLEEHLLVDGDELLVPLRDVGRTLARVVVVTLSRARVFLVVVTPFNDLSEWGVKGCGTIKF